MNDYRSPRYANATCVPSIFVTELFTPRAAENDDVWFLRGSGNAALLLAAEEGVDIKTFQ